MLPVFATDLANGEKKRKICGELKKKSTYSKGEKDPSTGVFFFKSMAPSFLSFVQIEWRVLLLYFSFSLPHLIYEVTQLHFSFFFFYSQLYTHAGLPRLVLKIHMTAKK